MGSSSEPCKDGSTDRDAVWVVDSGWSKEACITRSRDPPCEGQLLGGNDMPDMPDDTLP